MTRAAAFCTVCDFLIRLADIPKCKALLRSNLEDINACTMASSMLCSAMIFHFIFIVHYYLCLLEIE